MIMHYLKHFFILCLFIPHSKLIGQFSGAAGTLGSTALHKDSSIFLAWASSCTINRGYLDIANKNLGRSTVGLPEDARGKAGSNGVVSLGDSGVALLVFDNPIINGVGFDFAVFENGFSDSFLELAFVEVSSDSIHFIRFNATCLLDQNQQIGPFDAIADPAKINNLAGKYRLFYGTPFDLEELKNIPNLDINNIRYIKIIDVVGSIDSSFCSYDANGNKINDPYPTPFASSGFDLDAVGVINNKIDQLSINGNKQNVLISIRPIPAVSEIIIMGIQEKEISNVAIYNSMGVLIMESKNIQIQISALKSGLYFAHIIAGNQSHTCRFIKIAE